MSSLAKRVVIVIVAGLGTVGVATFFGRKDDTARFQAARTRIDAECRAYRAVPRNRHAAVCRGPDTYEPKAIPRYTEVSGLLDEARAKIARGDRLRAETALRSALAIVEDVQRMGTLVADLVANSIVKQSLEILAAHPELDRRSVLSDVRLDVTRPFEGLRLQHDWMLVQASRSADEIERSDTAFREMERTVARDVGACREASRAGGIDENVAPDACGTIQTLLETAARLDAARR